MHNTQAEVRINKRRIDLYSLGERGDCLRLFTFKQVDLSLIIVALGRAQALVNLQCFGRFGGSLHPVEDLVMQVVGLGVTRFPRDGLF